MFAATGRQSDLQGWQTAGERDPEWLEIVKVPHTEITQRSKTASYMEEMLVELRTISKDMEADFLTYLLNMALIEASDLASLEADQERFAHEAARQAQEPATCNGPS